LPLSHNQFGKNGVTTRLSDVALGYFDD